MNNYTKGMVMLSAEKKILLALPDDMVSELDSYVKIDGVNRTKLIRRAISDFIKLRKKEEIYEKMKKGYISMGEINLEWENACFEADTRTHLSYEEKLSECE